MDEKVIKSKKLKIDLFVKILFVFFLLLVLWWITLQFIASESIDSYLLGWAASYQIVAFLGGVYGLVLSRSWGGIKSTMGKAIIGFSIGLLMQTFGQSVFSFYNLILHVEIPYPSISDIGFFGSIPFYIYGIISLAKVSGAAFSLRTYKNQIIAFAVPLLILFFSYLYFLRDYEFDWSSPLRVLLDFGYPLGQAVYISLALLTYILSKKYLGGLMRNKVLFILLALVVQYLADYNFLYQAYQGTWLNGGYGDLVYLLAYFLMAVGISGLHIKYLRSN